MAIDLLNPERFELSRTTEDETGVRLFSLLDSKTGVTMTYPEPNARIDYASAVAWLGANTSRNGKSFGECFVDLRRYTEEKGSKFAGDKFGEVFAGYGHASVGDMATVPLLFDNPTLLQAYRLFSATPIGSGQEWSTRYGEKKVFDIPALKDLLGEDVDESLETRWVAQKDRLAEYYAHFNLTLRPHLERYLHKKGIQIYRPERMHKSADDVKAWTKLQGTLNARTLDVARMFIPMGAKTKQAYVDSARDWVRMSGVFRQSTDPSVVAFGEQIAAMLLLDQRPDAEDIALHLEKFTKYAEGSDTAVSSVRSIGNAVLALGLGYDAPSAIHPNKSEIQDLRDPRFRYESQTAILSALMGLNPKADVDLLTTVVSQLSDEELKQISVGMFNGHNHHELMHPAFDIRGIAYRYESSLAYLRDINRHRAFGRHIIQFSSEDNPMAFVERGWNDNYALSHSEYWNSQHQLFNNAMAEVYSEMHSIISDLVDRHGVEKANIALNNIIPIGAQMTMVLSAPIQQWAYMTSLRVGLGGDFGYRNDVWQMLQNIRTKDPGLSSMSSHLIAPDVNSVDQIVGRS